MIHDEDEDEDDEDEDDDYEEKENTMIDNPRGGNMTPEGNFVPADSSSHEMCCGTPANPSAGAQGGKAGAGPAGWSIILDLQSATEMYVLIPHRTGIVCKNAGVGIESFLLPTGLPRQVEQAEDPARGVELAGVTLGNLVQYQAVAEQWIAKLTNQGSHLTTTLRPLSVERMVDYLKTGLPIAEKWVPFQVSDKTSSPFYIPFIGKTAILAY